ncbi:DUF47 family protein [Methylomonas sp. SURF-1]|uniref:DUF47 family protein n=1 Tax=Methylomonas aurea TaxID=2952224 RepID=A0ABT1UFC3_9GAMM|nr:DUF47 family protein [Methylomonas sp. SURF-1]MCQ8180913.1 DUF47 family protein [Methylomonas sp. SURF-1]
MSNQKSSAISRILHRIFPKTADFYLLLHEQCRQVCVTVDNLARFMATECVAAGEMLKEDEHEADRLRMRNLHALNSSFATPMDREDIYRAIAALDSIVTYCKSTYNEMEALHLAPDRHSLAMVEELQIGIHALEKGFAVLGKQPRGAEPHAFAARHSERRIEKMYRKAIADLFQGNDYLNMFKQRELYRHLSNAADKVHDTANVLEDIIVKLG